MTDLLTLDDIHLYYGSSHILQGVSLAVERGSVVGLLGRNGVGKSSTLHSILGIPAPRRGKVIFAGKDIAGVDAARVVRSGVGWVPQGHRIFSSLSVRENFRLAEVHARAGQWNVNKIFALFPRLRERLDTKGSNLSGGEQQMLAIARALIQNPELLLMDEPSEGLSPLLVREVGEIIVKLQKEGCSILLVEQNVRFALGLASTLYVMNKGMIVCSGSRQQIERDPNFETYLGVSSRGAVAAAPIGDRSAERQHSE